MEWFKSVMLRSLADSLDLLKNDENYIHMKLPVRKISKNFEDNLKQRFTKNLINVKIREATRLDAKIFMELHKDIWLSTSMPYKPFTKENVEELIEAPGVIFLIANRYDKDIGFAIIHHAGKENEIGIITALGIIPKLQRNGLGTILGLEIWKYFKQKGLKELRCRVSKDNKKAYLFIRSLGFEELDDFTL
jgi:ribosomal protein S18 acetylase RimI-like enzyme